MSVRDEEGVDLASEAEARKQAAALLGRLVLDHAALFPAADTWRVEVRDEAGQVILTLSVTGREGLAARPTLKLVT